MAAKKRLSAIDTFLKKHSALDAYLKRIGAEPRNFRAAQIVEWVGKYKKIAVDIEIGPDGAIEVAGEDADLKPSDSEAAAIKAEFAAHPSPAYAPPYIDPKWWTNFDPLDALGMKKKPNEDFFVFFNATHDQVLMIEQRIRRDDGDKNCILWSGWGDTERGGAWMPMAPDGLQPLYGLEGLKDASAIFIHEGPKAARRWKIARLRYLLKERNLSTKDRGAFQRQLAQLIKHAGQKVKEKRDDDHPWASSLVLGAHVGWPGGALAWAHVDWEPIRKAGADEVYIVCDNDHDGVSASAHVSRMLKVPMTLVRFDNRWPHKFDLGDDFDPAKMPDLFKKLGSQTIYVGPTFTEACDTATWATDLKPGKTGRPAIYIRRDFVKEWSYVIKPSSFVRKANPTNLLNQEEFNAKVRPFSNTENTAQLLIRERAAQVDELAYEPGKPTGLIGKKFNTYLPSSILPLEGDAAPFLEFVDYLVPVETDRQHLLNWTATLIARPDVRMEYGVLAVSETQGTGKTTLGANILAPLVGWHNVSVPDENDIINSPFNSWVGRKRLVIVSEIYAGQSWKAYNKLKQYITDKEVTFNEKFQKAYTISNWAHFFASSNSKKALKIPDKDRRWFILQVQETPWPRQKWDEFYSWLQGDGLRIIRHWANGYVQDKSHVVFTGAKPPDNEAKRELVDHSRSEVDQALKDLGELLAERGKSGKESDKIILLPITVASWLADQFRNKKLEEWVTKPTNIRDALEAAGMRRQKDRMTIGPRKHWIITNFDLPPGATWNALAKYHINATDLERIVPKPM